MLTIFALATALVLPGMSRLMDQAASHAVFFEFQQQVLVLRREATRQGRVLQVVEDDAAKEPAIAPIADKIAAQSDSDERILTLRGRWRYTLDRPLVISDGGACSSSHASLLNGNDVIMTLQATGNDCRFIRVVREAERPIEPSSQR